MRPVNVFIDFDNTITTIDVFDDMVLKFSRNGAWKKLEQDWQEGKIGSRACLAGQIKDVRIRKNELNTYLAGIPLDRYFKKLVTLLLKKKIKTVVLSDNFDYLLKHILHKNGSKHLKVFSNKVRFSGNRLIPSFPFKDSRCHLCAHCKTKNLLANRDKNSIIIYIGDGRSDICPATYADIVFAKQELLKLCKERNISCIPFKSLRKVYTYLKEHLR